ncbi:MAG: ABC transporter ATP-binding protein [Hyphomicrobiaceae bacterium]
MPYDSRTDRNGKGQPPLVEIDRLRVEFKTRNGLVTAVRDVSLEIAKGETLGIVGESGSGKSVTSYALMRLLDRAGNITNGTVTFSGVDVGRARERTMRDLRGREMSMIFQNPRMALNPIRKVGEQIADVLVQHAQAGGAAARAKAVEMLDLVKIRDPEKRFHAYPFELSGGMCQRVVIALALACRPQLLIADEPTTGLDVTTQKAVMDLVAELTQARGMSTILITHDLGLAAAYCKRIVVMQDGEIVETAPRDALFSAPGHAYTRKLMRATPQIGLSVRALLPPEHPKAAETVEPIKGDPAAPALLEVRNLVKSFSPQKGTSWLSRTIGHRGDAERPCVRAVDDISFSLARGGSLGLVGESGCGKSTTSAMIMRLLEATSGSIKLDGVELTGVPVDKFARSQYRSRLQMVFQDPTDSLNPRFSARRVISDPIRQLGTPEARAHINERVEELATEVGLPIDLLDRFPHQLSGGQKARVGIARAIALKPDLLILDEPTAALDVSVQAVVLNLLHDLRVDHGMSYLFVSHDLNVVRMLCADVLVMEAGHIVERGPTEDVMRAPRSDYTRALIEATPHVPTTFATANDETAL